jgi:hypothetical protein
MMYCTCSDRNQWKPSERNLSTSSLHRAIPNNCENHKKVPVNRKSALKTTSRSTSTTPIKKNRSAESIKNPRFSTLPRTRPRAVQSQTNIATISRNEYNSDYFARQHQRRQSEVIPWQQCQFVEQQQLQQCTCRNNCYYCNYSYSHYNYPFSTSANALSYCYPYSTISLNHNYCQQQLQNQYPHNQQSTQQHHHSMINLNNNGYNQSNNNCSFHNNRPTVNENLLGGQTQDNDSNNSPALSNSPPPAPPPPPASVRGCSQRCRYSTISTPTMTRQSCNNSQLHLGYPHVNSYYGMQPRDAYTGEFLIYSL